MEMVAATRRVRRAGLSHRQSLPQPFGQSIFAVGQRNRFCVLTDMNQRCPEVGFPAGLSVVEPDQPAAVLFKNATALEQASKV